MSTEYMFGDGRPFPFLFLSMDYARAKNGATVIEGTAHTLPTFDSDYPPSNMADGSRVTYCKMEKICPRTSDYATVHYDLSSSFQNSDDRVDVIAVECDPEYPVSAIQVNSYTADDYSTGLVTHEFSYKNFSGSNYLYGITERVDGISLGKSSHLSKPIEGQDGNQLLIFLDVPIDSTRPYIRLYFRGVGRNLHGNDTSFDNGLWTNEVSSDGPTLITNDPYTNSIGTGNNHILLSTSGKAGDQITMWQNFRIRPNSEYVFRFAEKKIFSTPSGGESNPFQIELTFYDDNHDILSVVLVYKDLSTNSSWGEQIIRLNYKRDGSRYVGSNDFKELHEVPSGTKSMRIRFKLIYYSGDTQQWKIDDVQLFRNDLPVDIIYTSKEVQDSIYFQTINPAHNDGVIKIRRIGMFKYIMAFSDAKDYDPAIHDIGGYASCNPQSISENLVGTIYNRDPNGNIIGIFNMKSGPKIRKQFNVVMKNELRSKLLNLFSSPGLFTVADINCNWGEVVAVLSSSSFNSIASLNGEDDKFDYAASFTVEET